MRPIFICIGQCGCRIGLSLVELTNTEKETNSFLTREGYLPIVFSDADRKILTKFGHLKGLVKMENLVFNCKRYERKIDYEKLVSCIFDQVRDEIVSNDDCILIFIHGLIGNTGSGLTHMVMKKCHETYPTSHILAFALTPFESGESSFQHYHTMIGINFLTRYSRICFFVSNDSLLHKVTSKDNPRPSFGDMNNVAALGIYQILRSLLSSHSFPLKQRPSSLNLTHQRNFTTSSRKSSLQEHHRRDPTQFSRFRDQIVVPNVSEPLLSSKDRNNDTSDGIEVLSNGENELYFIETSVITEKIYDEKSTLMKLIRHCTKGECKKRRLKKAFLFCQYNTSISESALIECLSKKFQLVKGGYKVLQECNHHRASKLPTVQVICYQSETLDDYLKNTMLKVKMMLQNNAFVSSFQNLMGEINLRSELAIFEAMLCKLDYH